ncbi:hypothetical protein MNBD_GAMMA12-971 [hydrothermal vent metagenome]|uniref:DUF1841 domain-containing protein n=1 Tax=hydrothermal vent metagenome TaxID=652676 RepID=A0A3B0YNA9_9ZZZZ
MLFNQNREQIRQFYIDVWQKFQDKQILTPLETIIADVVAIHPEYHKELLNSDKTLAKDYNTETDQSNPFLHMGMHIGLREQVQANHPYGIKELFIQYMQRDQDPHHAEHEMIECLAKSLWEAQTSNLPPNDHDYLHCLKQGL